MQPVEIRKMTKITSNIRNAQDAIFRDLHFEV